MASLPPDLLAALPDGAGPVVGRWWASLSEADRAQLADRWDERLEVRFFTPQPDDAGSVDEWDQVPNVAGGRFVPHDDARGLGEWGPGYFEYLLQHPELVLAYEPARRIFHIGCTRHAAARACLAGGAVPAGFDCPVGSAACPLQRLRGARFVSRRV
ncbi:hypothetical protein [Fimbriiglobus ruber]|uniref:Uncharacterized protein n=1 Tax=Fimbriiglobus ruber TaxID=1908690 RepID=A0A225DKC1_9BACT|nr:hypothetical protein [Fimbriiglobus ruber]OWK36607.1 hypothetical protein FRUB_09170 [Fimbriiglobus ruber]